MKAPEVVGDYTTREGFDLKCLLDAQAIVRTAGRKIWDEAGLSGPIPDFMGRVIKHLSDRQTELFKELTGWKKSR